MNKQQYRGRRSRQIRNERHNLRAAAEREQLEKNFEAIKIDGWNDSDKPSDWIMIRVKLNKPVVVDDCITLLKQTIQDFFNGHI